MCGFAGVDVITPLKDVNVVINDGDVISIIGPSGTGKSTFLRCINLLERPTSGQIILDGEEITAPNYPGITQQNMQSTKHDTIKHVVPKPYVS